TLVPSTTRFRSRETLHAGLELHRATHQRARTGRTMQDVGVADGEPPVAVLAVEVHVEGAGLQSRRRDLAAGADAFGIVGDVEFARQDAQRAAAAELGEVEVARQRMAGEAPVAA